MERFKKFWKKAWHDPVGSKLISGAIIAAVGSFYLWAKSGFSGSLAVIWTTVIAVWASLSRPINLPVWSVLLTLMTFAVLAWWYYAKGKRALRALDQKSKQDLRELEDRSKANADLLVTVQAQLRQFLVDQAQREVETQAFKLKEELGRALSSDRTVTALKNAHDRTLPALKDLQDTEIKLLRLLFRNYDRHLELKRIAAELSTVYARAERITENLVKRGLVQIFPATEWAETRAVLTKVGRDYCDDNNLK
jgi:hypothetical protein